MVSVGWVTSRHTRNLATYLPSCGTDVRFLCTALTVDSLKPSSFQRGAIQSARYITVSTLGTASHDLDD